MDVALGSRFSTYSIVARDPESGQFGLAVQTHQMCVGVAVPWLMAGVGAIATQAMTNVRLGPMGLALLQQGLPADKVLEGLIATDESAHNRQVAVVDREGRAAAWTGENCIPVADHLTGSGFAIQANMMLGPGVVAAMAEAYSEYQGDFPGRLLAALKVAQEQGGDIRGMQSAALKIVASEPHDREGLSQIMPSYDLRVDENKEPLLELERLIQLRRAVLLSNKGFESLEHGNKEDALARWEEARHMAPALEELAFWQAATLADDHQAYALAAAILQPMLENVENRKAWIDLLKRIQACGILEKADTAEKLIEAIGS